MRYVCVVSISAVFSLAEVKAEVQPLIRVLVSEGKELVLRSDGKIPILVRGLDQSSKNIRHIKFRIDNSQIKYLIRGEINEWTDISSKRPLRLWTKDPRGLWLGERRYGGELVVHIRNNQLRVVNHLPVEKYLKSVVGSEMPKTWPLEALKAQAIAARTYVLNQKKKNVDYDVKSSQESQVYLGVESETSSTKKAVEGTRSLVMIYKGKLIDAVFHSSAGGITEDSGYVWDNKIPYLVSVKDPDKRSPSYKWEMTFSPKELKNKFTETGGINTIRRTILTPSGRISKARIYGPKGTIDISGKELRKRLGLKSTLVQFKVLPYKSSLLDNKDSKIKDSRIKDSGNKYGVFNNIILSPPPPLPGTSSPPPLPLIQKNYILIANGYGSGHGVGMSQWGANALANEGQRFRDILNYYYKGIRIVPYTSKYIRK